MSATRGPDVDGARPDDTDAGGACAGDAEGDRGGARPGRRGEGGFVLVWFAVVLVLLLAFAALAVDVSAWYRAETHAQKAVDASSLAGVVYMPEQFDTAEATAREILERNGYVGASDDLDFDVEVEPGDQPNQLRVTMVRTVRNAFAQVIGFPTTDVRVSAVAEFERPVAMGSPSNAFGNQPECVGACTNSAGTATPQFWANVAGPASDKIKGDAYQAQRCRGSVDNCPGGRDNLDYDPEGYSYIVRHEGPPTGTLRIDAFDPGFVNVGDTCQGTNHGSQLTQLWNALGQDPRYEPGPDSPYCTGDQYFNEGTVGGVEVPPDTSFRVFWTNDTPWTTDDDVEITSCRNDFPGYVGSLPARWFAEQAVPGLDPIVTEWFRRWVPLCTISGDDLRTGDYRVQVRTNVTSTGAPAPDGAGHNRFAMRAARNGSLGSPDVSIFGDGRMAIYANARGADTQFHLARVLPGAPGRELSITFFDVGDAGQPGTIRVLPPQEATMTGPGGNPVAAALDGCRYTPPPTNTIGPPWGTPVPTGSGCAVGGVQAPTWDGQWITWIVPIPDGYDCDFSAASGCWFRLQFVFPPSTNVNDTTTWRAALTGDPVRIVE